jgi:hypothetical protein
MIAVAGDLKNIVISRAMTVRIVFNSRNSRDFFLDKTSSLMPLPSSV